MGNFDNLPLYDDNYNIVKPNPQSMDIDWDELDKVHVIQCLYPWEFSSFLSLYRRYAMQAARKGIPFALKASDFAKLTSANCTYCGRSHYGTGGSGRMHQSREASRDGNTGYFYNGVDRIDSKKGYTIENCQTCCWECNRAKSTMTDTEFRQWFQALRRSE